MVKVNITNFGKALLIKALHNESPINFVSMQFGNGEVPENYEELTALMNPLLECSISSMEKGDNYIQLTSVFDNSNVEADFDMTEIGVFAEDATLGKGLFAYVNQENDSEPVYSENSNKLKENQISVQIIVDDAENVTATVKSLVYATKQELEDHIKNYENPHRVTAAQIGLGKVENTTVADAAVKFTAAKEMVNIESGEKVATIFGKIYTALKALLAHLTDYKNPHKVTPMDIKAAAEGHLHSAADIKTGTLAVGRGGTGRETWTGDLLIYADTATSLAHVTRPAKLSVLMQDSSGKPYFQAFDQLQFVASGSAAPANTNVFWIDPTPVTGGLKYHNGSAWVHVPVGYADAE